jgi:kumamolisin
MFVGSANIKNPNRKEMVMPTAKMRSAILGSEKKALPNAKVISDVDPDQRIEVTVVMRPRTKGLNGTLSMASQASGRRKYLNREEFTAKHGAHPDDLAKVEAFAHQHHLTITETNCGPHR